MATYTWKGRATGLLYQYERSMIPAALLDEFGTPLEEATLGGETLVFANTDGSVRRPTRTGPPLPTDDPYDVYLSDTPWDTNTG